MFVAVVEQQRQKIAELTSGWDDPTQVDWETEDSEAATAQIQTGPIFKCTALYSYTVH